MHCPGRKRLNSSFQVDLTMSSPECPPSAAPASNPYVLTVQTEWQMNACRMLQSGESGMMLHIDATGQTNKYNCPLFAFLYKVRLRWPRVGGVGGAGLPNPGRAVTDLAAC